MVWVKLPWLLCHLCADPAESCTIFLIPPGLFGWNLFCMQKSTANGKHICTKELQLCFSCSLGRVCEDPRGDQHTMQKTAPHSVCGGLSPACSARLARSITGEDRRIAEGRKQCLTFDSPGSYSRWSEAHTTAPGGVSVGRLVMPALGHHPAPSWLIHQ